jgi:cytoskeletal protein CcmA (bactofilin family)
MPLLLGVKNRELFMMKKRKKNKTQQEIGSFLGKNIKFEGDLKFSGAIRIEGHVKGNISGEGTLIIDIDGKVESDIIVSNVINYGEIHGDIIAGKKIDLRASGIVFGNIKAPVIEIEEGATFQGNCQTHQIKRVDGKKPPVIDHIKPEP